MIVVSVFIFLIVLCQQLNHDYKAWRSSKGVDHSNKMLLRAALLLPSIVGMSIATHNLWSFLPTIGVFAFLWWILFDGIYNIIRKYPWWFTGGHGDSTEINDSKLDLFLEKIGKTKSKILKIGGFLIFVLIYTIIYIWNN